MSQDRPRYLGRTHGYVDFAGVAADPLEAVDTQEQARQTAAAHAAWARTQQRRWGKAAKTINGAIAEFYAGGGVDRRLASDLRAIRRGSDRVSQRLAKQVHQAGDTADDARDRVREL